MSTRAAPEKSSKSPRSEKLVVAHLVEYKGEGTIITHLDLDGGGFHDPLLRIVGTHLVKSWTMFPHGLVKESDLD